MGAASSRVADRAAASAASPRVGAPAVVQIVQSFGQGGLEAQSVNLAVGLAAVGVRPVMVALEAGGVLEDTMRGAEIEYHVIGNGRFRDVRTQRAVAAVLRKHRPHAVHTHHFAALASTVLAAAATRVPRAVHTEHAYQYLEARPGLNRPLRWMSRRVDTFVVVGAAMRDYYVDQVGVAARRMRVICNGVDTARFRAAPDRAAARRSAGLPSGLLVGTAGRFATVKNFPMLLSAVAEVRRAHPDVRLVLAGDGVDRPALEAQAEALGFGGAVHFLGWRTDLPEVLRCLDVFALTSWTEGLPLVVLEAMACGVPVVSTRVGDIPLIIEAGVTGDLVPAGDVAALSAALGRLVRDETVRRRVGAAGRAFVMRHYSQDAMVHGYLAAYGLTAA